MAAIIFDFDGTILDSFDYVVDFLAREANKTLLEGEERQALRHHSMMAMARGLGFGRWRLPRLFFKGRQAMIKAVESLQPFSGMPEVIRQLHAEGYVLFIVSSNNVANLHSFLHKNELHEYFLEIYGGVGLFGKASALRGLVKEHNLDLKDCLYIGDEIRDVKAAKAINMRVIAVLWGFASNEALRAQRPTATAETPADIIRIIEEL